MGDSSVFIQLPIFPMFGKLSSDHSLNDSKVQEFIHRNDLHFDLVILEEIYHDSWLMFGHKFKAPIVTICKYERIYLLMSTKVVSATGYIGVFYRSNGNF